jgi:hypothetical protein
MKKHMRLWFIGVLMVMGWVFAQNAAAQSGDFKITNGVLVRYLGSGGAVVIPAGVTAIGDLAFYGCSRLKPELRADIEKRFGKAVFE